MRPHPRRLHRRHLHNGGPILLRPRNAQNTGSAQSSMTVVTVASFWGDGQVILSEAFWIGFQSSPLS